MPDKMAREKLGFAEDFMLSGVAAIVSKTAAAPIERVKLLMQNQDEIIKQGRLDKPYKGVIDCTRRVLATEGFLLLWRGNFVNVLGYFPKEALNFAFKDRIEAAFATPDAASRATKLATNVASGGSAGVMSNVFVYSLNYTRTRLANDAKGEAMGGGRQFNGIIDVYLKTLKSDGIQGLYRGFVISAICNFVYRGFYFGLYDTFKPMFLGADAGVGVSFILGWAITVTAGLCSYPLDTIMRRMMMTSGAAVKYKSSLDCCIQIVKKEGVLSLMKGASANVVRGLTGAGVLVGFDAFKAIYVKWRTDNAT